jgi:hypothetical protein
MLMDVVHSGNGDLYGLIGLAAGTLALLVYAVFGLIQSGFFRRARHLLVAEYHEFEPSPDGPSKKTARFALRLHNLGARPVTFLGFEYLYPRLAPDDVFDENGKFKLNGGARLRHEGVADGILPSRQEFAIIDRLERSITLAPRTSRTEVFDTPLDEASPVVLVFHDSAGQRYHVDADGIHGTRYAYPFQAQAHEALGVTGYRPSLVVTQRPLSRRYRQSERLYRSR